MSAEKSAHPNYKLQKKLMRRRAIRESWPLLVWLGVAALALWAYKTGGEFHRMRGVVSKPVESISAPYTGRLVALPTDDPDLQIPRNEDGTPKVLNQGVFLNAGDVIAKIDTTELELEIKVEEQNALFDRAKLQQDLGQQILDYQAMIPKLQSDEQRVEDELDGKKNLIPAFEKEVKSGLRPQTDLDVLQNDINNITAELAAAKRITTQTQGLVDAALQNIEELQSQVNMDVAENAKINLLNEKIRNSTITALSSGFVEQVYAKPGSLVKAGDPIVDIVVQMAKTITALIPEVDALSVKQGDSVYIATPGNEKQFVTATVLSLQQSLTQIPDYGSPIRGRMVRGRVVEFGNLGGDGEESDLPLLPGSEVIVSLDKPGKIPFLSWFE